MGQPEFSAFKQTFDNIFSSMYEYNRICLFSYNFDMYN